MDNHTIQSQTEQKHKKFKKTRTRRTFSKEFKNNFSEDSMVFSGNKYKRKYGSKTF